MEETGRPFSIQFIDSIYFAFFYRQKVTIKFPFTSRILSLFVMSVVRRQPNGNSVDHIDLILILTSTEHNPAVSQAD